MPGRSDFRLLVVDDNEVDRMWIAQLLEHDRSRRYAIDGVATLTEACARIEAVAYDCAIVDWYLPDGSGVELAAHPVAVQNHLPVVIITGNEGPEQGPYVLQRGAADFLPKDDLTTRALTRACAHALTRTRLERALDTVRRDELAATQRESEARVAAEAALADERRARARVDRLHTLSSALLGARTTAEVAACVVQHAAVFEHARAVSVYLVRGESLCLAGAVGFDAKTLEQWATIPLSLPTPLTDAVRGGEAVEYANLEALCERITPVDLPGCGSWLALPLASQDEALGVVGLRFDTDALPPADDRAYVELVAQHVAQALHRAQLYDDAQHAAEFEARLLAVVGHDLRTPLTAVLLTTQLLRRQHADEALLGRIDRSAQRMAALIADVLDRAAVRRGLTSERGTSSTDLETVVTDVVDELRTAMGANEIRLEIAGDETVECDPSRTSQIVSNLVRNAIQHGAPGAPITVRVAREPARAVIAVHNHGPAIAPAELPALFDPFKRGTGAVGAGSGLGLFIVHETVTAMRGTVHAASDAAGTTFTVVMPAGVRATKPPPEPAVDARERRS